MKQIVTIGYQKYVVADGQDISSCIPVLMNLISVDQKYVNSKYVYCPNEDERNLNIELLFVKDSDVRDLTKTEKENQEISSLKYSLENKENAIKKRDEEIEALKCKLKILSFEAEEEKK